jgi:hypothetical protein
MKSRPSRHFQSGLNALLELGALLTGGCQPCPTNRGGSLYGCEVKNKWAGQALPTPDQPLHSSGRWRAEAIWKPKHTTPIFTET